MKENINNMIGNTPLIKINYKYKGKINSIYTKIEYYNFTGSIKDRMALYIIEKARRRGDLKDNQAIIEATSGNTGISLAALSSFYSYPIHIFMPDWVSVERRELMRLYGATIHLVSKEEGGFKKAIELADNLAKEIGGYRPNQFENTDNVEAHYLTTGKEIVDKVSNIGGFVSGIGTGGTLMGVGKLLKELDINTKIYAMEPDGLPLLSKGINIGSHKIEGIGDDFIPAIVNKDLIDEIIVINDMDAINMSRKIAKELGLGVGISSGANFIASIIAKDNNNRNIVTVFADDNKKYLSTDLSKEIDLGEHLISNSVELINYEVVE